jgi:flagellar biosynthesis protein FliQ
MAVEPVAVKAKPPMQTKVMPPAPKAPPVISSTPRTETRKAITAPAIVLPRFADSAAFVRWLPEARGKLVLVSAPMLLVGLVVGLTISIFQTLTHIQEMTLTFIPKARRKWINVLAIMKTTGEQEKL